MCGGRRATMPVQVVSLSLVGKTAVRATCNIVGGPYHKSLSKKLVQNARLAVQLKDGRVLEGDAEYLDRGVLGLGAFFCVV